MAQPLELAAVVAVHVAPDLRRVVMAEPTVELDVDAVLLDDHVEMLAALRPARDLPAALRKPMSTPDPGVTNLKW
jgi:hypothetical protein